VGSYVFEDQPGEYWCAEHAPAAARYYGEKLECDVCSRPYPGRSGLCGACRPRAERKACSVRAEDIALQALRKAFPAEEGPVLTHNRAGMGGQNDNICQGAPGDLANTRYRVDFILWHVDNPNMVTLWELDEHPGSSYACDDARTVELFQRAPSSAPMMMLRVNPDAWMLEKADGSREKVAGTRNGGGAADHALMVARFAPAVAAARAFFAREALLEMARIVKVSFNGDALTRVYEYSEPIVEGRDVVALKMERLPLVEARVAEDLAAAAAAAATAPAPAPAEAAAVPGARVGVLVPAPLVDLALLFPLTYNFVRRVAPPESSTPVRP
jgi:hypothetical protein